MMPCHVFNFLYIQSVAVGETFATCAIAYLAYLMRKSYRCRKVKKEIKRNFKSMPYVHSLHNWHIALV